MTPVELYGSMGTALRALGADGFVSAVLRGSNRVKMLRSFVAASDFAATSRVATDGRASPVRSVAMPSRNPPPREDVVLTVQRVRLDPLERMVSVTLGASCLASVWSKRRSPLATWLTLSAGAFLLRRGIAGLCGHRRARAAEPSLDVVDECSRDSFPASDPPSWTPTTVGAPYPRPE